MERGGLRALAIHLIIQILCKVAKGLYSCSYGIVMTHRTPLQIWFTIQWCLG